MILIATRRNDVECIASFTYAINEFLRLTCTALECGELAAVGIARIAISCAQGAHLALRALAKYIAHQILPYHLETWLLFAYDRSLAEAVKRHGRQQSPFLVFFIYLGIS